QPGLFRFTPDVSDIRQDALFVHAVDVRPCCEVVEIGRWRLQARALHRAAVPQQRHDKAETDPSIEVCSANSYTVICENVIVAVCFSVPLWAETHDGEV